MLDKQFEELPSELKEAKELLKNTSYDDSNGLCMTQSSIKVIDFDKVKDNYVKNNISNVNPNPKSNDALYISLDGRWIFIEFKNGVIDNKVNFEINKKIYDSLLILFDINFDNSKVNFENTISFTRNHMDYILVYNKEKYKENKQTSLTREGLFRQEQESYLQDSISREELKRSILKLGGNDLILFGLDQFQGYFFNRVLTYTQEEFEKEFVHKYRSQKCE